MSNSEFIASLIGPVLLALSLSLLLNRQMFLTMIEHINDHMFVIVLAGIALLVSGIAIVRVHDVWDGWPVVVTLFGWLAILGGLVRILFGPRIQGFAERFANNVVALNIAIAISLGLGLFLTGKGFAVI